MRLPILALLALPSLAFAQAPAPEVKPVPPPGVPIPDADRVALTIGVDALDKEIVNLRTKLAARPELLALLPDVMIFHKAVDWALRYDEFFDAKQIAIPKKQLETGMQRAKELRDGKPTWNSATGLVVRGYISKIDGSVQPYGLVIPDDWKPGEKTPRRLDFWCHGRGEKLSELDFINQRQTSKGEFTPPGAFVLHLYGRYCCANKFAGEVDLFEALENASTHYAIDRKKLVVRGFSMGGASTWQFGTHFAGMWAAVQPGAGFGETAEFNHVFAEGKTPPPWWEQVLYRWYDSTGYVSNLANTTTVAYSGEIDGQKQAADFMIRYARKEAGNANPPVAELGKVAPGDGSPKADDARVTGTAPDLVLYHVIGPKTPHKVLAEAKPEIEKLVGAAVEKGRDTVPEHFGFTTYTLIYPRETWVAVDRAERKYWEPANVYAWVTVDRMGKHWERANVRAKVTGEGLVVDTSNVSALSVSLPVSGSVSGRVPSISFNARMDSIDGQKINAYIVGTASFHKEGAQWKAGPASDQSTAKRPDVCGPIDHAFMSSFVFVRPTGKPLNDKVGGWVKSELDHATTFWRKVFRGDAPAKDDTAINAADIANSNLVLWGDPSSNAVLKKIADKLPVKWDAKQLIFNGQTYDAAHTAPVLIFPNPLNPQKYVVLNSGVTFREEALLNNAQQIPKLPDWAIIDLNTPPNAQSPGLVIDAGFFNEQWK